MKKNFIAAAKTRAKVKAAQKNKAGAVIMDLAKPDGQYTKQIICVECGAPRRVKPQDAWQVKRCVVCQNKKKGAKLREMIAKKSSPEVRREDRTKRVSAKLDAWVARNDEECARFAAYRKRIDAEHAKQPKRGSVWPK